MGVFHLYLRTTDSELPVRDIHPRTLRIKGNAKFRSQSASMSNKGAGGLTRWFCWTKLME